MVRTAFDTVIISTDMRRVEHFCYDRGINPRSRDLLVVLASSPHRMEGARVFADAKVYWLGVWGERAARRVMDVLWRNQVITGPRNDARSDGVR